MKDGKAKHIKTPFGEMVKHFDVMSHSERIYFTPNYFHFHKG